MDELSFLWGGWEPLARIAVVGVLGYAAVVAILRTLGNRTLASMSAFDFIVTVAMGAVIGRSLTAHSVSLAEMVAAFGLLVGLQYVLTWARTRWPALDDLMTAAPVLLYYRGRLLREALRRERVTEAEVRAWVRKEGHGALDEVDAVVLESDGSVSVITTLRDGEALEGVNRLPDGEAGHAHEHPPPSTR